MKWALGLTVVLSLALPGSSLAAQRYAAPAGSGTACTEKAPCLLKEAVTKAKTGDEVIVTAGSYALSGTTVVPFGSASVDVHGETGGPMPTIVGTTPGGPLLGFQEKGGSLRYLDVTVKEVEGGYAVNCTQGGHIERVIATASGKRSAGALLGADCVVRDSLLRASGTESMGVFGSGSEGTGVLRNVTAIATGPESAGVRSNFLYLLNPGSYTLSLKNVIASGQGADLRAFQGAFGPGNIVVSNSNFDSTKAEPGSTLTDAGGNQTAAPLFVDAAGGNFEEAAGSPTIDAGVADQLGTTDLFGHARVLGAAPDIGAYEFVPPAGQIESLSLAPKAFRPLNGGGAIFSRKKKAPVGATVTYSLSTKGQVEFFVERKLPGRLVGGKCRKVTRANRGRKKCAIFRLNKNGFAHSGLAGANSFKFSGRVGEAALKPGAYRLTATTGQTTLRANFRIVK